MAITDVFDTAKSRKSYKYSAIPDAGEHEGSKGEAVAWKDGERKRSLKKLAVVGFLIAAAVFFVIGYLYVLGSGCPLRAAFTDQGPQADGLDRVLRFCQEWLPVRA